jgi:tripartite-type tricarboxylate transporter receptor subunit TctC
MRQSAGLRRLAAWLGLLILAATSIAPARAESYPSRPVRIIVGFGPGSVADIIARVMAAEMNKTLGQQLVVENRPGAGSSLGAEFVARAPKDGYTLLMCTVAQTINPVMNKLSFDFGKDLAPITLIANAPQMLVAHPSLGVSNVRELIALAKSKPDEIQYASSGVGTMSHLSGVLLNNAAGIKLMQVPYPGSAQSMTDVLAGRVPLMFGPASTVLSNVRAGKLKALAVTQLQRAAIAPDVPTMVEAGVPGYSAGIWMGLLAPIGTPQDIVDKLSQAARRALQGKDVLDVMHKQGVDPLGGTPADFARHIDSELKKWAAVADAAGLKK